MPTKNELLNAFEEALKTWLQLGLDDFDKQLEIGANLTSALNELSWITVGDVDNFDKHETWLAFQRLKKECGK